MTQRGNPPNDSEIAAWIGEGAFENWQHVTGLIEQDYPNVFTPEWLFGGKKHGWSLRYKKGKSFCTFIPERNRFALLLVFGAEERKSIESMRDMLSVQTRREYDNATTYHDGKWVLLTVNSATVIEDVRHLLSVKRRPKTDNRA
jgi:hypothetical protein